MSGDGGQPPAWNDPYDDNPGSQPSSDDPPRYDTPGQAQGGPDPYAPPPGSGWNDPYGPQTQPGWDPYGQYGAQYGGAPPPYPYGYAPQPDPPTPASTVAALVCNIVAVSMCFNILAIPGIVTAAIAMSRHKTDPERAKTLTIWSWSLFGASIALVIIVLVVVGIIDASNGPDYDDYNSY